MDPFTAPCSFQNLLNSQQPYPSVSDASAYGTGWPEEENEEADIVSDRKERRKWSPTEDKVLISRAPKVNYTVNGHNYRLAYYLTDGIYPNWATFVQSIREPQGPKASLFATKQEAVRKDVERAFGVLQARFAIVKNPALLWDKIKIGKIMRACIILHNMIVEDERDKYTLTDVSVFEQPESSRSSHVDLNFSTQMPTNLHDVMGMLTIRNEVRDNQIHQRLKADLVENIWQKFGTPQDFN
uniref:DDE Tnp4 domain-containing protein n=1 Tax=Brassica oleracea var. oleracea TaxID=109376 RepID=A0A0D3ATX1_BRAOL